MNMLGRMLCVLSLGLVLTAQRGCCIVAYSDPEVGSTIAGFENETNILVQCKVVNGTQQRVTIWLILKENDPNGEADLINNNNPDYNITGDPVPGETLMFRTNLTILSLTADFDRAVLFCASSLVIDAGNFTIRIYRSPVLKDLGVLTAVEGDAFPNGNLGIEQQQPFPFPGSFTWSRDGDPLVNISANVSFGYPELSLNPVSRTDSGLYTLTASNYLLDNDSVLIGNGTGSFTLDVLYGPELDDVPSLPNEVATLDGDPITLLCGENLNGNPTPLVEWRDSANVLVPRDPGSRYNFSDGPAEVSLTIDSTVNSDTGNWTCTVSVTGPGGEEPRPPIVRTISVFIVVTPDPPSGVILDTDGLGSTSIGIQWFPPTNEGVPPFSWYNIYVAPTMMNFSIPRFIEGNVTERNYIVTELLPGVTYEFSMTAVSKAAGFVAESNRSNVLVATTDTTVPLPECSMAPSSENGVITVSWDYVHTGGLNLTSVQVLYRFSKEDDYLGWLEGDVNCTSNCSLAFYNLTAGYSYVFVINASNDEGPGVEMCPEVNHTIGIPPPFQLNAMSDAANEVLLTVIIPEDGVGPAPYDFLFLDIEAVQGASVIFMREVELEDYVDGTAEQVSINDPLLVIGETYTFRVRIRNAFGSSESNPVTISAFIPTSAPPQSTTPAPVPTTKIPAPTDPASSGGDDNAAAIAGGVVGGLIAVILIILIILVSIYLYMRYRGAGSYKVEGGDRSHVKIEEVEIDIGDELQGNPNANGADKELHYAELDTFKKPPPAEPVQAVSPTEFEEPVEYATIQAVAPKKPDGKTSPGPVGDPESGDKSLTSTSLV